jgi:uncharacterized protein DUF4012
VLGAGTIVADAYWQAHQIADPLEGIRTNLSSARTSLAHGKLPEGDPFSAAVEAADQANANVNEARWTFRLVGKLPLLGRPMTALRQEARAASEWSQAAIVVRDIVVDLLGDKALRRRDQPEGEKQAGAPVFHDGVADVKLISTIAPRLEGLIGHLEAAQAAIARIKPVPFYGRLTRARDRGLEETRQDIELARNAIAGAAVLPTFLGANGPRTYFLALQNNSDLRGTGGAVLAFAFLKIDRGKLELIDSGPIGDIDNKSGGIHAELPPEVSYYIRLAQVNPRLANGANYSPNLPVVAKAWSSMIAKRTGIHIDGAIVLDPVALSYALGNRELRVNAFAPPITVTAENAVRVVEHDQYTLPTDPRHAFAGELIKKAWKALSNPAPFVPTLQKLGQGFREKHIQIWSTDRKTQDLLAELKWDGALKRNPGDYLYLVDNKRIANKVDYYAHQKITYTATIQPSGSISSTYEVSLDNDTPLDDPPEIAGRKAAGTNLAQMSLYVPKRAEFRSVDPDAPITADVDPKGFEEHEEGAFRVFTKMMDIPPQTTGTLRYAYSVPDVIDTTPAGKVYQLTLQHQPLVNPARVTLVVRLPKGTTVKSAPGWKVNGNVATLEVTLTQDMVTRIVF